MSVAFETVRVGDYLRWPSGTLRKVIEVCDRGVGLVQLADGRLGGPGWWRRTIADGARLTSYMWTDLRTIGVTVRRAPKTAKRKEGK